MFVVDGCGVVSGVDGVVVFVVEGDDDVVFFDAFFLACFFGSALSAGTVPPTSTPATAAGAATLIVSAFVPAPAVAVLPPPPELEMPNAAAKAAITAIEADGDCTGFHVPVALLSRALRAMVRFSYVMCSAFGIGKTRWE